MHFCVTSLFEWILLVIQATPNVNLAALRLSITADWDRLAVDYICKSASPAAHSAAAWRPSSCKMAPTLNKWAASCQDTQTSPFQGYHKLQQKINACTLKKKTRLVYD
jgi:hypothetical protein